MALFEVWRDGKCYASTEQEKCIYPLKTMLQMQAAGCTFKMDGKRYVPKKNEVRKNG